MLGLYELPYPKKFILAIIKMRCNNRIKCVRYLNCLCEWFKRKVEANKNYVEDYAEDNSDEPKEQ
jgi:hypothetical protein